MEVARGKFYNEDTHFVVIQAENVLHRVPRYALVQHSELFRDMFQLPQQPVGGDESGSRKEASTPGGEGSRDENPIKIPACFTNFEFESLLEFIYPAGKTKSLSQEQLLAAFKLATHWEMHDMISNIENCILTLELTPTEKLKLGKEWKIRKLLEQGFFSFVAQMKYEPSAEEASGLGWDAVGQILLMRENLRRQTMAMPVELMFLRCKGKPLRCGLQGKKSVATGGLDGRRRVTTTEIPHTTSKGAVDIVSENPTPTTTTSKKSPASFSMRDFDDLSSAVASPHPPSMDDINMDGSTSSNEVQWQSSQASSVLESLLARTSSKSRHTSGSEAKGTGSYASSGLSMGSTASSSSSMPSLGGSDFVWPVTGTLDKNTTSTVAAPLIRRRRPGSALSSTCRKSNLSSSSSTTTSSSSSESKGGSALPSKKEDITESFKLFVKQATSKVDENLAHNAPTNLAANANAGSSTSATGLSRTNSRSALLYGGLARHHSKSGKPVSASGVASAAAASGVTTAGRRSLQGRTLSANAIFSGSGTAGREHRVGGDDSNLRSKGKAKESNAGKGADDMDMDVDTPATVWKVPQVSVGSTGSIKGAGNAGAGPSRGADTCAMPPPALPPERLQQGLRAAQPSGITQNSVGQHQRPQPSAVPAISAIPSSQQSVQGPTVPVQASSQQQHQSSKPHLSQTSNLHISAPAPPSGAFNASSTSTSATTTVKVNAPASTTTTTHFASVPAAPATTTTVRSSKPPVLGMRRAHTFVSSSGSNNSAHVFGSQQQAPSSQYSSNRHANGLPTKQRAFKAPSFQKPPQAQAQGQLAPQPQLYPHPTTTATSATSNAPSTAFSRASSSSSFSSSVLKPTPSGHSSDTSLGVPAAIPVQPNNAYVKTQAVTPVGGTNQNPSANHRQARFNTPTTTFVFAAGASNSGSSTTRAKLNSSEDSGLMRSKSSESTASSASSNSIQSSGFERSGWSSSGTSVASNSSGKNHIRGEVVFELEDASEEEELEAGRGRGSVKEGDGDDSSMLVESGEDPDSSYGDISFDLDELEEVCKNYD